MTTGYVLTSNGVVPMTVKPLPPRTPSPEPLSDQLLKLIHSYTTSNDRCTGDCAAPDAPTPAHQRWNEIQKLLQQIQILEAENAELKRKPPLGVSHDLQDLRARFIRSLESTCYWRTKYERLKEYIDEAGAL